MAKHPVGTVTDAVDFLYDWGIKPIVGVKLDKIIKSPYALPRPISFSIAPKEFSKLLESSEEALQNNVLAKVWHGLKGGIKAKKGKIFFRDSSNTLVRDKKAIQYFDKFMANAEKNPELLDFFRQNKVQEFHEALGIKLFDAAGKPMHVEFVPDLGLDTFLGSARDAVHSVESAKAVGINKPVRVVFDRNAPLSFFPKKGPHYSPGTNSVHLSSSSAPGDAYHEFSHAKDYSNWWYRVPGLLNTYAGDTALLAYPLAYVAGDQLKEKIPGTIDDKIIDFIKRFGPEVYLASRMGGALFDEYRAYRNTTRLLKDEYSGKTPNIGNSMYAPDASIDDLIKHHRLALSTYPIKALALYGGMRGGTAIANHVLNKESSLATAIAKGPFIALRESVFRGIDSMKHLPTIVNSMVRSSPNALPRTAFDTILHYGLPLGAVYGIHYALSPTEYAEGQVKNAVTEYML